MLFFFYLVIDFFGFKRSIILFRSCIVSIVGLVFLLSRVFYSDFLFLVLNWVFVWVDIYFKGILKDLGILESRYIKYGFLIVWYSFLMIKEFELLVIVEFGWRFFVVGFFDEGNSIRINITVKFFILKWIVFVF